MQTGLNAFERPRQTLDFAKEAIDDFEVVLKGFFDSKPLQIVIEHEFGTGNNIHKIKLTKPIPNAATRRSTEALNNTKNAFDQMTYAAFAAIGQRPKKDIHFPWRCSPADLERCFIKKDAAFPEELRDIFRRHEPYPRGEGYTGGNDHIRELARISNNKHTVGLAVDGRVSSVKYPDMRGTIKSFVAPALNWDPVKNEMIMMIVDKGTQVKHNHQFAFQIVFSDAGLKRVCAPTSLAAFLNKAEQVFTDLVAECRTLGAT